MGRLALTVRSNERVFIGNDVIVTVVWSRGERVRVLVEAPPTVAVDRESVRQSKRVEGIRNRRFG